MTTPLQTRVAIVGAGPAGLLLSHLLERHGIDSIVLDERSRQLIVTWPDAMRVEAGDITLYRASDAGADRLPDIDAGDS